MRIQNIHKRGAVFATTQVLYGNGQKDRTAAVIDYINKVLPFVREQLGVSDKPRVVVMNYKGNTLGSYSAIENAAGIDPRQAAEKIVDTLVHELTHARQYERGELQQQFNIDTFKWECIWKGKTWGAAKTTSYQKYLNQPWEIEARQVATEIGPKVIAKFGLPNISSK